MKPSDENLFGVSITPYERSLDESFQIVKLVDDLETIDMNGIQDHPYTATYVDTWTLLTALAVSTKRVRFFTNVVDLPLRLPSVLAKAVATLDDERKNRAGHWSWHVLESNRKLWRPLAYSV
ncbi:MAG: LLM class flavin-dependent oxidoreductase [archaeon]|nr:LLM class flavin-dependent oxidoreductase [archaeon]